MNENKFLDAVTNIDSGLVDRFVEYDEKAEALSKRKRRIRFGGLAACLAVVLAAAITVPMLLNGEDVTLGGTKGPYKNVIKYESSARIWQWEYMTVFEKYVEISFDGKKYSGRGREISEELLGKKLGVGKASGYDVYTEKTYSEEFDVYRIDGVSEEYLIAVKMEGKYYVFDDHDVTAPKTFGELMDRYKLTDSIAFSRFSVIEDGKEGKYYRLEGDSDLWSVLSEGRAAEAADEALDWRVHGRDYLSFTVSSQALGVYKHVLYVTEDGYLWTNALDYGYLYFIGTDAAERIISYAKANSSEAEFDPYEYTLAGKITEIGDGYFILDDTPVCVNEKDGKQYKILTDDIRIRRCIEVGGIGVGDIVVIKYDGKLYDGGVVKGAYAMSRGVLGNDDVMIPE